MAKTLTTTLTTTLAAANNGSGYAPVSPRNSTRATVVLWGKYWNKEPPVMELSGCPDSRRKGMCPSYHHCRIFWSDSEEELRAADVVVLTSKTRAPPLAEWLFAQPRRKPFRVVYRREAFWGLPFPRTELRKKYDLDMSFRPDAGIGNPTFLATPNQLFKTWGTEDAPRDRPLFALSLVSDCTTLSHRELYIKRLAAALGPKRYHRYGKCGDGKHVLGKYDFSAVRKYRFLFEFENTVQAQYHSEKLFFALSMGPVPVYMGSSDAPNITLTRSYIDARDFATPEDSRGTWCASTRPPQSTPSSTSGAGPQRARGCTPPTSASWLSTSPGPPRSRRTPRGQSPRRWRRAGRSVAACATWTGCTGARGRRTWAS